MAGEQIVIIDDDPDIREALTMILKPVGYRVTCHATGPGGLTAIRATPPDLIFLDIMLASPTEGYHLASELRRDDALSTVPVIMISSYRGTLGMDYAREMGDDYVPPDKFLDKPLTAEAVLEAVEDLLAKVRSSEAR